MNNMNVLCMQCNEEFGSLQELQEHMKKTHIQTRRQEFKVPVDRSIPNINPVKDKPLEPQIKAKPFVPVPPDPIKLEYVYHGQCPQCRNNITTLNINISDNEYRIAWCEGCKLQLAQKRVIPIDKMDNYWVKEQAIKREVEDSKSLINKFRSRK